MVADCDSGGGGHLVCSFQLSTVFVCQFLTVSSLHTIVSCHVGWGLYLPGNMDMKSFIGQLKMHAAGFLLQDWVCCITVI